MDSSAGTFAGEMLMRAAHSFKGAARIVNLQSAVRVAHAMEDCFALAQQGKLLATFRGTVEGRIIDEERGPYGFGYDPMFYYEPFGCTFGEAGDEQKFAVSHRGQALRKMLEFLGC